MIGKLKGIVESIGEETLLLDVGGVCYRVFLSSRALQQLPEIGSPLSVFIETHMREDHIHLYGFLTEIERQWFILLCTVQGVGAKMGLSILSSFSPPELVQAIAAKDSKVLTRASGVGAKLAERLITELKGKVGNLPTSHMEMPPHSGGKKVAKGAASIENTAVSLAEQAVSALANLGYGRSEAYQAVSQLQQEHGNENSSLEDLIRHSLQRLAR